MKSIRWVKAHLKIENATRAGVCYEDRYGNNEADIQTKSGAAKHEYTESQKICVNKKFPCKTRSGTHAQELHQ
eukprot:1110610-Heterocapsa_arctica.AAC.1